MEVVPKIASSHLFDYPITGRTERLRIRPLTLHDAVAWEEFTSDPIATRYFLELSQEDPQADALKAMKRQLYRYKMGEFGMQALELIDTGELIGQCGLIAKVLDGKSILEIGYLLLRRHWGQGFATEAAMFFKSFAASHKIAEEVHSLIHIDNTASMAVAERNGMERIGQSVTEGVPVFVYQTNI